MPDCVAMTEPMTERAEPLASASDTCLIYQREGEQLSAVVDFLRRGLEHGERCLLVTQSCGAAELRDALSREGGAFATAAASGALAVVSWEELCPGAKPERAGHYLGALEQALAEARAAGFCRLRLVDQMCWVRQCASRAERLAAYSRRSRFLEAHGIDSFSLYDRRRFDADLLLELIRRHPQLMVEGVACRNRCYRPDEELTTPGGSELELERLLEGMREEEVELKGLRTRVSLLETVVGASEAIFIKDCQGRILLINPAAAEFVGREAEELIGLTANDFFPPASAARILAAERQVMQRNQPLTDERVLTTPRGDRTVLTTIGPYRDENGKVIGIFGIGRDIDDRKKVEEELRISNERFLEAQVNTRHVLYRRNAVTDRYDYISPFIEELTGYPHQDFLQFRWADIKALIHPDDLEQLLDPFRAAGVDNGGSCTSVNLEYRMRKKTGGYCWFSDWVTAYYDEQGEVDHLVGSVYDITAAKQAEQLLRESEERYRELVELSPEAIFIAVAERFVFVNAAGAALFGAERPEQLYGREVLEQIHPEFREVVRGRAQRVLALGESNPWLEELYLRLDGSTVPVEVAALPFNYRGEPAIQVMARDISERKKMQLDMLRAQKLESLGVLAGGIAHDFNNLLTGVFGNLSLAQLHLEPGHQASVYLEACERSIRQTTDLTRQLLTFARGGAPAKKLIDTAASIRDAASFTLSGGEVRCVMELADDLWCMEADGEQFNQVLHNFLFNAVQAMPGGGEVRIAAGNELVPAQNRWQLPQGSYVRIDIEDGGCGIPPEHLAKIFDPYFTTKAQGTGLGLASVYSIVKRHGGGVEVSSQVGAGSRFTVRLPASPGERPEGELPKRAAEPASLTGRILVMDDDEVIREVLTGMLQFLGYQSRSCRDGKEAVELVQESRGDEPFAAVILDLTVPGGMGGKEAAALMGGLDAGMPLIVSSGYSNDPIIAEHREYGFSGVIVKPFAADRLAAELKRLLG